MRGVQGQSRSFYGNINKQKYFYIEADIENNCKEKCFEVIVGNLKVCCCCLLASDLGSMTLARSLAAR